MTRDQVAARVRAIELSKADDENAHAMEDLLHQDVLRAIASGACSDPAGCADEALNTLSIEFERWCA